MIDLNALRVFEKVASLRSFSAAARALGSPKSSVSRSIAMLEAGLGTRLLQRTTHAVELTEPGVALRDRCAELLARVDETLGYVSSFSGAPRGLLRISAGVGFGINVLSETLPEFLQKYPEVDVWLDLSGQPVDLIATSIDVAIRIGPLQSSELIARRLGTMNQYLCAAPAYLARKGTPLALSDLSAHDTIALRTKDGRARSWTFMNASGDTDVVDPSPRLRVNEALTIHRLVLNGAGIGCISAYLCTPDIQSGRLVRLFPEWKMPALDVSVVFPSHRELAPAVRAFIDFMTSASTPGTAWQSDALEAFQGEQGAISRAG